MANFSFIFWAFLTLCGSVTFRSSDYYKNYAEGKGHDDDNAISEATKKAHIKLLKKYLFVYLMAALSDWLQGPYVYALYSDYEFDQHEIAQLFVAGFGSSMVFGSFVGGIADQGGRRLFVIIFAAVYLASCVTKHFKSYNALMLGRLLGGVSTSLLFSVFEAWLIKAHADANLPKQCLPKSFSWAAFGNSAVAIMAGLVANHVAHASPMVPVSGTFHKGGFLNPFDLAIVALIFCAGGAILLWEENYGSSEDGGQGESETNNKIGKRVWYSGLMNALTATMQNRDIFLCGIISSLFEGSMYIFVFMWTPLLKAFKDSSDSSDLPFGLIFATFMVCCMTGSSFFSIVVEKYPVEKLGIVVFGVGAIAMSIVALEISETVSFLALNLFEMCVGMYFPIMGTMKGGIVPEDKRAAIYNLYRIPLNCIVLISLLTDLTPRVSFMLNAFMLLTATGLQMILAKRRLDGRQDSPTSPSNEETKPLTLDESAV
mmetsp:Transcript_8847/g.19135  ORF Transcript_8847/g.19135 Transcript_8847/m.19135 type:complete len:486 (+) Transcript_8847:198-1655(+)|eukprot:CAMPEP_0168173762 /NCGR_PEP_ID=MMETSP0139_2-20121125/6094_1 /TAXON_ID=44445 /ORGANISM="Pseudo-nitzschia australis, Strain 10249 10 AB" /LENGTH=485 /DNA_ID=CAMNT_0008091769 /DNA_START=646 /DNA_END=2103 /DNA_ORIENTATION=-